MPERQSSSEGRAMNRHPLMAQLGLVFATAMLEEAIESEAQLVAQAAFATAWRQQAQHVVNLARIECGQSPEEETK
jgi:hypothetical protein